VRPSRQRQTRWRRRRTQYCELPNWRRPGRSQGGHHGQYWRSCHKKAPQAAHAWGAELLPQLRLLAGRRGVGGWVPPGRPQFFQIQNAFHSRNAVHALVLRSRQRLIVPCCMISSASHDSVSRLVADRSMCLATALDKAFENIDGMIAIMCCQAKNRFYESTQRLIQPRRVLWSLSTVSFSAANCLLKNDSESRSLGKLLLRSKQFGHQRTKPATNK